MRRRVIDPNFWTDSKITELSFNARLLYIGLWQYADDEGLFIEDLKNIKMTLFPDQNFPLQNVYGELIEAGFFRFGRFTDNSVSAQTTTKIVEIRHFKDHQTINRPTPSKLRDVVTFNDDSLNTHSQVKLSKENIGDSVSRTESDKLTPNSSSNKRSKKPTHGAKGITPELQPVLSKVIDRINELAGTAYRDDKPDALEQLIARLHGGATETECMAVVEHQWLRWGADENMVDNVNPVTLFRKSNFQKYLQNAQRANGNGHAKPTHVKDLGGNYVEVDGRQVERRIYEKRYGTS